MDGPVPEASGPPRPDAGSRRSPVLRWIRRGATVLVSVAVLEYLVLPQIAGTEKSLHLLGTIRPWWVASGVVFEGVSLVCYSMLTLSVLADRRVGLSWILRSDLTGLGVSHLMPGGAATANALRYRLLREGGADAGDVTVALAIESIGATLTLLALLWLGLLAAIPMYGPSVLSVTAAALGAVLAVGVGLAVQGRSRLVRPMSTAARALIRRLPQRLQSRTTRAARAAALDVEQLLSDPRALRACARWAVGNWVFDAASLWLFLAAYGHRMNPVGLLVAYAAANALAILPISPGGLGLVEGALIPGLLGFGTPSTVAILGVLSWRLFEFWAPIPVAGVCYVSIRAQIWYRSHSSGLKVWDR